LSSQDGWRILVQNAELVMTALRERLRGFVPKGQLVELGIAPSSPAAWPTVFQWGFTAVSAAIAVVNHRTWLEDFVGGLQLTIPLEAQDAYFVNPQTPSDWLKSWQTTWQFSK